MTQLNPIEKKIAAGMSPLVAFLTNATCGEACWQAREDVCRCSCGGRNHGCMRTADGARPTRNSKIDGIRYELKAIGDVYAEAEAINKAAGDKHVKIGNWEADYPWQTTETGAPARVKKATKDQVAKWPELSSARQAIEAIKSTGRYCWHDIDKVWPDLLWVKAV
jgi:hypothetical protein